MASYKIRTAGNCPAVFFYYQVSVHNRGDAYSILESDTGTRCRNDCRRRDHSPLRQRKLESDAEVRCRYGFCRQNYSSLQLRKLESDAEDCCHYERIRRNLSSLPLRKLESDAEDRCRYEISRRNHSPLHRFPSLGLKSRIDARMRA